MNHPPFVEKLHKLIKSENTQDDSISLFTGYFEKDQSLTTYGAGTGLEVVQNLVSKSTEKVIAISKMLQNPEVHLILSNLLLGNSSIKNEKIKNELITIGFLEEKEGVLSFTQNGKLLYLSLCSTCYHL